MSRIIKINASIPIINARKQMRVAVYARVSTDEEDQVSSLKAQEDYYLKLVAERPDWVLAGIYIDKGITGTSYRKRDGFQRMLEDCVAGKADMIITKSISRFARNTVDTINTVRKLKALGIGVKFEKENIWSLDGKGEFVLTLMAGFAQEEAFSLSENVKWGLRKRMADGQYWVAYGGFLGYGKGFAIEEEGAYTVKLIYKLFLMGFSTCKISKILNLYGFDTPARKGKWYQGVIRSILGNEKYKGDALMQNYYTVDFLTKRQEKNKGELPKYYVTGGHEPIIPPILFDYVQNILMDRSEIQYSGHLLMSSKLRCGKCGAIYGSKVIHSTDRYRHTLWQCLNRFNKDHPCRGRHFRADALEGIYEQTYRQLLRHYPNASVRCRIAINSIVKEKGQLQKINKCICRIPAGPIVTDVKEWAMLIENITVYDESMVLLVFGGEKIKISI